LVKKYRDVYYGRLAITETVLTAMMMITAVTIEIRDACANEK